MDEQLCEETEGVRWGRRSLEAGASWFKGTERDTLVSMVRQP